MGANSPAEHPLPKEVIVRLASSFLLQVGARREILGLFARDLLVFSHSDGRLYDSWNIRPFCVLTHFSLLFSLRLVKFPCFLIFRTAKLVP
jgi:hypothetical protein